MLASAPLIEIPETLTGLPVPTFLSLNVAAVLESVKTSPVTRLSVSVTVAEVFPSYCLFTPVALTVSARFVMSAVVFGTDERA